jgi:hypothetical protein
MVAKKKSRNGRKTARISPSARDSGWARPRVAAKPAESKAPQLSAPALPPAVKVEIRPEVQALPARVSHPIAAGFAAADIDALARASVAVADGVQSLGRALIEMQREAASAGLSAASALVDAHNLQDVIEIQRRFVTGRVESAVRETGGLAQLASRVAREAWAPLAPRLGTPLVRQAREEEPA